MSLAERRARASANDKRRRLAAKMAMGIRPCRWCGEPIPVTRTLKSTTCCRKHAQQMHDKRRREREAADPAYRERRRQQQRTRAKAKETPELIERRREYGRNYYRQQMKDPVAKARQREASRRSVAKKRLNPDFNRLRNEKRRGSPKEKARRVRIANEAAAYRRIMSTLEEQHG